MLLSLLPHGATILAFCYTHAAMAAAGPLPAATGADPAASRHLLVIIGVTVGFVALAALLGGAALHLWLLRRRRMRRERQERAQAALLQQDAAEKGGLPGAGAGASDQAEPEVGLLIWGLNAAVHAQGTQACLAGSALPCT